MKFVYFICTFFFLKELHRFIGYNILNSLMVPFLFHVNKKEFKLLQTQEYFLQNLHVMFK